MELQIKGKFPNKKTGSAEEFWEKLKTLVRSGQILGCYKRKSAKQAKNSKGSNNVMFDGQDTGLKYNCTHGIIDVKTITAKSKNSDSKKQYKLLWISPQNNSAWTGEWSRESKKWRKYIEPTKMWKNLKKKQIYKDAFLIEYLTWANIFNFYFFTNKKMERGLVFYDEWDESNSGGMPLSAKDPERYKQEKKNWVKNPQYLLQIKSKQSPVTLQINLEQEDVRLVKGNEFPYKEQNSRCKKPTNTLFMAIFEMENKNSKLTPAYFEKKKMKTYIKKAQRSAGREFELENGTYIIVPSTKMQNKYGKFSLSLQYDCKDKEIQMSKIDSDLKPELLNKSKKEELTSDLEKKLIKQIANMQSK